MAIFVDAFFIGFDLMSTDFGHMIELDWREEGSPRDVERK